MHPRLEDIRKRLQTPPVPSTPPRYIASKRAVEGAPVPDPPQEPPPPNDSAAAASADENLIAPSSSHADPPIGQGMVIEPTAAKVDERVALETPKSMDGLARAVAELFEPARQCQNHLAEITAASELISHLTRRAVELCGPLQIFHDHIQKLSSSFESMRTFRDELAMLAESFSPVRALHGQVIQLAETVRAHLAEVANGLEPAKALQVEIANLGLAISSVRELQEQFYELSKAFGDATEPNVGSDEADAARP
jgi:hypothetical protein